MPKTFTQKVLDVAKKIPKGKTLTYKEVAEKAGSPGAFRAVGNILNKNYDPNIPCHRVIKSNGEAGGYNKGRDSKINILRREGVKLSFF
ncbi:MAG: methylated-DNA-[protein]-cysteine S-methyltransferase [Patescibacteria group bacterium]|jgi:O-6-methylguanine DNA methyltransferase|nr:methylated-DNA-[protein]-cysteine S-methyltransferase [Patescibacteria group bacterium]